jgi:hypothetical protein
MPLNLSGPISLGGSTLGESIALQLSLAPTGTISLDDVGVRTLAEVPTGAITMPDNFWGKPAGFSFSRTITSDVNNYNLFNEAVAAGWDQITPLNAAVTIGSGVRIASTLSANSSFLISGSFPTGTTISVVNNGTIVGRGGNGGGYSGGGSGGGGGQGFVNSSGGIAGSNPAGVGEPGTGGTISSIGIGGVFEQGPTGAPPGFGGIGQPGQAGGTAFSTNYAISLQNNGTIAGGGGGGGGGGLSSFPGGSGTFTLVQAGAGGNGGSLGNAGSAGQTTTPTTFGGAGGAAGFSISGYSFVTLSGSGTLVGPTI